MIYMFYEKSWTYRPWDLQYFTGNNFLLRFIGQYFTCPYFTKTPLIQLKWDHLQCHWHILHTTCFIRMNIIVIWQLRSEYQWTSIWIMYDPCAVRILMVRPLLEDCCVCFQAISKDWNRLRKSALSSTTNNFSNTSQTTCSCNSLLVLSRCHCCNSTVVDVCCDVSPNSPIWSCSTILSLVPLDWCGWCEVRGTPSAFMLLLHCLSYLVVLCCFVCEHINETKRTNL